MDKTYRAKIEPRLADVLQCRRRGGTAQDVCRLLGVSPPTLRKYLRLAESSEEYLPLRRAYEGIGEDGLTDEERVEQALYKACTGYVTTVSKQVKLKNVEFDPQTGKKLREWEEICEVPEQVHVPASIMAQRFYLMNRLPERWQVKVRDDGGDMDRGGVIVIPDLSADGDTSGLLC
ncbi:MAG: hypothetical protein IKT81_06570 [Clostridia bacterium]|nr:hypothetical protein [Clostridia bacterium]MBR4954589.1 hypothetical protein [Clostridia bacterium]